MSPPDDHRSRDDLRRLEARAGVAGVMLALLLAGLGGLHLTGELPP